MRTLNQRARAARKARGLRQKRRELWDDRHDPMAFSVRERWELVAGLACIAVFVWIFVMEAVGS